MSFVLDGFLTVLLFRILYACVSRTFLFVADAIFCVGVRIQLIDIVPIPNNSHREDVAVATSDSSTTLQETVSTVLGHKFVTSLTPLTISLDALLTSSSSQQQQHQQTWGNTTTLTAKETRTTCTTSSSPPPLDYSSSCSSSSSSAPIFSITGLISKNPQGASLPRTINYFCINGRPVDLPNVNNVLRKIWQGFGGKKRPSCVLHFRLPNHLFDVNLSPDKRQVLLTMEQELCSILSEYVTEYWSSQTNGVFTIQTNRHLLVPQRDDKEEELDGAKRAARTNAANQESYESPDNGDSVGEMGERKRHKRRNAFVHDLSKARMQHEHEHRIIGQSSSPASHCHHNEGDGATTATNTKTAYASSPSSPSNSATNGIRKRPSWSQDEPEASPPPPPKRSKSAPIQWIRGVDQTVAGQPLDASATNGAESATTTTTTRTTGEDFSGSGSVSRTSKSRLSEPQSRDSDDRLSDRDRIGWTAVQQQFSRRRNDDELLTLQTTTEPSTQHKQSHHSSTPVTPEETFTQHATLNASAKTQMATVPVLKYSSTRSRNGRYNGPQQSAQQEQEEEDVDGNGKKTANSLSQFAFQSVDNRSGSQRNSSTRKRSIADKGPDQGDKDTSNARPSRASARQKSQLQRGNSSQRKFQLTKSDSETSPAESSDSEPESDSVQAKSQNEEEQEMVTETDQAMEEDVEELNDNDSSKPRQSNGNAPSNGDKTTTAEPVIWQLYQTTEIVCQASRLERHHMRRRKRRLQEVRKRDVVRPGRDVTSNSTSSPEVGVSVGLQEDKVQQQSQGGVVSLSKEEFRHGMEVIGQFNLGFILARCKNNHIWILDQHASDEKYNFENLCRTTIMHEQKLLAPMSLELSSAEEACILDHLDIFKANGFSFQFDPDAPIRHRLSLTALPHSGAQDGRKAVQFGKDDVSALCSILMDGSSYDAGDGGTGTDGSGRYGNNAVRRYASTTTQTTQLSQSQGQHAESGNSVVSAARSGPDRILARLPKAIAMFASRACRTSIMIGTALSHKEMERVVKRLADVDHPWNCPHGRPTMRHVGNILPLLLEDERKAEEHIAGPTMSVTPMTQMTHHEERDD
jgi:DNA mismatch repair ATPase MutL